MSEGKESKFIRNINIGLLIVNLGVLIILFCTLKTTERSVELSDKNSQIGLRAYLQADSVFFYTFMSGKEMRIAVRITNVGQTPAYNIRGIEYPKIGGTGIYESDFLTLSQRDTMTSMFIGGNRSYIYFRLATDFFPTKEDSIKINRGELFVGYYAKFFYDDIFGRTDSFKICNIYYAKTRDFVLCENYEEYYPPYPNLALPKMKLEFLLQLFPLSYNFSDYFLKLYE